MGNLDILRNEQSRRLEALEKEIRDRELTIKELDSRIDYSKNYFKSLEESIGQLSESVRTAVATPAQGVDVDRISSCVDSLRREMQDIQRAMTASVSSKSGEITRLEEKLTKTEGQLDLLKKELQRSERAREKAEDSNSLLTQIKTDLKDQVQGYEDLLKEVRGTTREQGEKYEELLGEKNDLHMKILELQNELESRPEQEKLDVADELEESSFPWREQIELIDKFVDTDYLHVRMIGTKGMIEEFSDVHTYNTAILLTCGETRLLVDYGQENPGEALLKDLNPSAVLISHSHSDHVSRVLSELECPIYMSKETNDRLDPEKYEFRVREIFPAGRFKIEDLEIETFGVLHSVKCPMTVFKISNGRTTVGITTDIIGFHSGDKDKFFEGLDVWITDCSSLKKDLIRYDKDQGEPFGHLALEKQLTWIKDLDRPPKVFLTHFGKESVEMSDDDLRNEISAFQDDVKLARCVDGSRMVFSDGQPVAMHGDISVVNLFEESGSSKKKEVKDLSTKQLKDLRELHAELIEAKTKLKKYLKKPPESRSDIERDMSYIQDAMVDLLKAAGAERVVTEKYIYSLRRVPTHFKVISENKVLSELKKAKLHRFIKTIETIDMGELRPYLVENEKILPGLRKIDSDVSIYIYERHAETPELVQIIAHEDVDEKLIREMFAEVFQEYRKMAIVGSRSASQDMLKIARLQAQKALEAGWGIVTGGARGIDLEAIRQATMNTDYAKKLTVYLPKTIDDQPAETWELLGKAKKMGAKVVENAGAHEVAMKTKQSLRTVPYADAALARNKLIMRDAHAAIAIQAGSSTGTQHAIKQALNKGLQVKHIDQKTSAKLLQLVKGVLKQKALGRMKDLIKGMGRIVPGIANILDAVDLGILWKELDNLEKDIAEGTATERQKQIWEYLQQQKEAGEDASIDLEAFDLADVSVDSEFPDIFAQISKIAILGPRTAAAPVAQATAQTVNEILSGGGGIVVSGAEGTSDAAIRQALRKIKTPTGGSMEFNVPQIKTHLDIKGSIYTIRPYDLSTQQVIVDKVGPCIRTKVGTVTDELLEKHVAESSFKSVNEWKATAEKIQVKKVGQPAPPKILYKVTQLPKTEKLTVLLTGTIKDQPQAAQLLISRAKTFGARVVENAPPGATIEAADGVVTFMKSTADPKPVIKTALGKGKVISTIDENMKAATFWKAGGKYFMKNIGVLTGKILKGIGTVMPGISIVIEAIEFGRLWRDVNELPEKLEKDEPLNENQRAIVEQLKQQLEAAEPYADYPPLEKLLEFEIDLTKKEDLEDLEVEGDVEYGEVVTQQNIVDQLEKTEKKIFKEIGYEKDLRSEKDVEYGKVDAFLSDTLKEELKDPVKYHKELRADAHYLGNAAYPRLKNNESWGDWTLDQVLETFGKIVDVLRTECFYPYTVPKKTEPAYDSSFWKCYRESKEQGFLTTDDPPETELAEWARKRKELLKFSEYAGLYLTEPHSELIWAGVKPSIVKSVKFQAHIDDPLYLLSDSKCWGVIKLSEPQELSSEKEFKERYQDHLIEDFERAEWWDTKLPLYLYEVSMVEKFDRPRSVELPVGPQVFLKPESIKFVEN